LYFLSSKEAILLIIRHQ